MNNQYSSSTNSLALHQLFTELLQVKNALYEQLQQQFKLNSQLINAETIQNQNNTKSSSQTGRENGSSSQNQNTLKGQPPEDFQFNQQSQSPKSKPLNKKISKSDTKNIPKNYLKAIISFIKSSPLTRKIIEENNVTYSDLMINLRRLETKGNSIQTLKKMWGSENVNHKVRRCIRILSHIFMRKHSLHYIFNSKVKHYVTHIKYRRRLIEGIENPTAFNHIKQY